LRKRESQCGKEYNKYEQIIYVGRYKGGNTNTYQSWKIQYYLYVLQVKEATYIDPFFFDNDDENTLVS
jgi:hypothetical protein